MMTTNLRPFWKQLASQCALTPADMAALFLVRALKTEQPFEAAQAGLLRAFTPIRNPIKLANGQWPFQALHLALSKYRLSSSPVLSHLTPEEQQQVLALADTLRQKLSLKEGFQHG